MKTCPNCGHKNPETATTCESCGHDLIAPPDQPPSEVPPTPQAEPPGQATPVEEPSPTPAPDAPQPERHGSLLGGGAPLDPARPTLEGEKEPMDWRQYAAGIALGMLPVIAGWLALGNAFHAGGPLAASGGILYVGVLVGGIVCLIVKRIKYVGYGLMTMLGVGPVVWTIGCIVILAHPPLPHF